VPECPDVKNYKWRLNPVWHRMLYSCAHMATVGIEGLTLKRQRNAAGLAGERCSSCGEDESDVVDS